MTNNSWDGGFPMKETVGGTNQSTYAKGDILYASAVDTLSKLAYGADNNVYYVNTDIPGVATGTPGQQVLLSAQTASTSASIDFTSVVDSSKYSFYRFIGRAVKPADDGTSMYWTWSTDNGVSYLSSGYAYSNYDQADASSGSTSAAQIQIYDLGGTSTGEGADFEIYFYPSDNPSRTYSMSYGNVVITTSTAAFESWQISGLNTTSSAINGFKFAFSSGNIDVGEFMMYGIHK